MNKSNVLILGSTVPEVAEDLRAKLEIRTLQADPVKPQSLAQIAQFSGVQFVVLKVPNFRKMNAPSSKALQSAAIRLGGPNADRPPVVFTDESGAKKLFGDKFGTPSGKPPALLLVDDNAVDLYVAKTMLEKRGCTVTTIKIQASTPADEGAIARFQQTILTGHYDMLIMDANLGDGAYEPSSLSNVLIDFYRERSTNPVVIRYTTIDLSLILERHRGDAIVLKGLGLTNGLALIVDTQIWRNALAVQSE